ncbi:hypothetical protein ACIA8K_04235 [Catenuloplanes sp. NPDC051500]|uniref:hypothetical protein n=1 Tax=Catenuloplanes sp. NPDC051500 TaxID=3363959 RepID=UPI00379A17F8
MRPPGIDAPAEPGPTPVPGQAMVRRGPLPEEGSLDAAARAVARGPRTIPAEMNALPGRAAIAALPAGNGEGGPLDSGAVRQASGLDGVPDEALEKRQREQRQLRLGALVLVTLLVLGALPLYFGIRAATRDPVFNTLDELGVPTWAAQEPDDQITGSRWCFIECRLRERTATSEKAPEETTRVYQTALDDAGWQRWQVDGCPDQPVDQGDYSCWRRDELTLDLWIRPPACADGALAQRPAGESEVAPPEGAAPAADCPGAAVSIKVNNAIGDGRTQPQPSVPPEFLGETPDATFDYSTDIPTDLPTDLPLPEPTQ